jgi:hypothetical protein
LELNGTHELLIYVDDNNLLGDSINTIKENTETLLEISRAIGLEVNAEKTKYMIMCRHPKSGQNQNIRIPNESFEKCDKIEIRGPFEKFMDWRQCAAVMQREAVTVMPSKGLTQAWRDLQISSRR